MPLVFLNGNSPSYPGVLAETDEAVIQAIKDTCIAAGWELHLGDFNSLPMVLRSQKIVSGQRAYFRFSVPVAGTVAILADLFGDGAQLALNGSAQYNNPSIGTGTRVWCTADQDTFAVYVKPVSLTPVAYEFGWLTDIPDPDDPFAWGAWGLNAGVTTAVNSGRNKIIARNYNTTTTFNSSPNNVANDHISAGYFARNLSNGDASSITNNLASSKPLLFKIPIVNAGAYRGTLKFCRNGTMGGTAGGHLLVDGTNHRYVLCGTGQFGFTIE